jgi:biopolymer transport protein TolR
VALSVHDAFAAGRRRGRARRGRRAPLTEINVTPLVDVMLVLLIIFMISAPLLTAGVPLQLPKTEAAAVQDQDKPITVSIRSDGRIFIGQTLTAFDDFAPTLRQTAGEAYAKPIFVRADGRAPYALVAQVMASLSQSGFTSIDLITDTGGPSSGVSRDPGGRGDRGAGAAAPSP